jgi:hypothetical protein
LRDTAVGFSEPIADGGKERGKKGRERRGGREGEGEKGRERRRGRGRGDGGDRVL